jgi:hypothetical protein
MKIFVRFFGIAAFAPFGFISGGRPRGYEE